MTLADAYGVLMPGLWYGRRYRFAALNDGGTEVKPDDHEASIE